MAHEGAVKISQKVASVLPLKSRPLDAIYFTFFLIHIPASLLIDLQSLYPKSWVPGVFQLPTEFYVKLSNDPLIGGVAGYLGNSDHLIWFKTFLWLELLFQLPVFVLGLWGLWKGFRSFYVLFLAYGASTATTTLPCVIAILTTPSPGAGHAVTLTVGQRVLLLSSYVPFLLVPLIMTLDMAQRVLVLVRAQAKILDAAKGK